MYWVAKVLLGGGSILTTSFITVNFKLLRTSAMRLEIKCNGVISLTAPLIHDLCSRFVAWLFYCIVSVPEVLWPEYIVSFREWSNLNFFNITWYIYIQNLNVFFVLCCGAFDCLVWCTCCDRSACCTCCIYCACSACGAFGTWPALLLAILKG